MAHRPSAQQLIVAYARQYGVDPEVALRIASAEGGVHYGATGDGGHAFGPFQMNDAGGVLTGRPGNHAAYANSPKGIDEAMRGIAKYARGLHGRAGVAAGVKGYERPANPGAEIARAMGYEAGAASGAQTAISPGSGAPNAGNAAPDLRRQMALALISQIGQKPDLAPLAQMAQQARATTQPTVTHERVSEHSAATPHGKTSLDWLSSLAKQLHLTVTSTTGGHHVPGSYHGQGRAEDDVGTPQQMAAALAYAIRHPKQFVEAFYTGPGAPPYYVKDHHVYPVSQLDKSVRAGHRDHAHLAR